MRNLLNGTRGRSPAARAPRRLARRGSAAIFLLVLITFVVGAATLTMALSAGVQSGITNVANRRDATFYAAEAGVQWAIWNMQNNSGWIEELPKSQALPNGYTYTITTKQADWPGPVVLTSTGRAPDGAESVAISVTLSPADTAPTLAIGGQMSDSGSLQIQGNVDAIGDIDRSGTMTLSNIPGQPPSSLETMGAFNSSGNFSVPANILANNYISASGNISAGGNEQCGSFLAQSGHVQIGGTIKSEDSPNLSLSTPTVNTSALINQAGTVTIPGGTVSTLDFTQASDGILYVSGDVDFSGNMTIIGTGTLVVAGNCNLSGAFGQHNSPAPMNLVISGDLNMSGSMNLNGLLYVGQSMNKSGTTTVNGVVVVKQDLNGSGNFIFNYAAPPSFLQVSGGGGSGQSSVNVTNFTGPVF